ncbi:MAG: YncE family protein [Candidatus Limnocylindria bacterium]
MRTLARILTVAALLGACGTPPAMTASSASPVPPPAGEQVYLATDRGVSVVGQTGAVVRELPRGVAPLDWSAFYTVEPGATTTVRVLDPATGAERKRIQLPGRYDLGSAYRVSPTGLSRSGVLLTLEAAPRPAESGFAVVDTGNDSVKTVTAPGEMTVDVVSDDGRSLYLVEHKPDNRYNVRIFDLGAGRLDDRPIGDLKQIEVSTPANVSRGLMAGIYQASVDGRMNGWHFSLYSNPGRRPFIHALNVTGRYATCILDLPVGAGPAAPGFWTMVLAPSGRQLYAANAVEGTVSRYDAETLQSMQWKALKRSATATTASIDPGTAAAISPEGYRLYVVAEAGVVVIDTATLTLKAHLVPDRAIRSIALSPDGRRLYALSLDGTRVWALDAMSGQPLATLSVPGASSIARVR